VNNPYQALSAGNWPQLAELAWQTLKQCRHGDLKGWLDIIDSLPDGVQSAQLDRDAPVLGRVIGDVEQLSAQLIKLHPWRKGPLNLAGIDIDTEWRSDWKWGRIAPHIDLNGHQVLDIGCGNGYFGLRMLGAGAKRVIGIDPTMVFVMQWLAMQKLCPGLENFVMPLGIEDLPTDTRGFGSVFSMGVLYHRRNPVEHLSRLKALVRPGGQIILESLIIDAEGADTLNPEGRYARMRNVHAIPTMPVLADWLAQAGLPGAQVLDISKTSTHEQRSTVWMKFESLRESLDPGDDRFTVEGYPAPVRVALLIRRDD